MEFFACSGREILYFARKAKQEFEAFPSIYKGVLRDFEHCRMRCKNAFSTSVLFGSNFGKNARFCPACFMFCRFYDLQNNKQALACIKPGAKDKAKAW